MKVALISVGTRGDMEPFLALAWLLKSKGHSVVCIFPEQFRSLVEEVEVEFLSLRSDFIDLLVSKEGKLVMGGRGSILQKVKAYVALYRKSLIINRDMVDLQIQYLDQLVPDRVIYNGKSTGPLVWGCVHKGQSIILSPVPYLIHAVDDHPHIGVKWSWGRVFNRWTYTLANFAFVQNIMSTTKGVRQQLDVGRKEVKWQLENSKMVYTISPALFQRPTHWPEQVKVLGYHERPKNATWKPDAALKQFLGSHQSNILFVTFGSMTNSDPEGKGEVIRLIIEKYQIPTIINRASGGININGDYDGNLLYITDQIPYDWILPYVYAMIHHGGSGTTHMGLKYGCASMVIPHIIDQFVWDDIVVQAGAGPRGVSIQHFSMSKIEKKVLELLSNDDYKVRAEEIAQSMEVENYSPTLVNYIVS